MYNGPLPKGIFSAQWIPTDPAGRVNRAALASHLAFEKRAGIDGVLALGSTGEFPHFSVDERKETLALLAGTYDLTPVVSATVSLRDGKLIYRATGDPKDSPLTPARGLHFAFDGNALVSVTFHRGPTKQISHFVLYVGDASVVGTRRK